MVELSAVQYDNLLLSLYILVGWATLTTVMVVLARRDVILGLKKWLFIKLRKQPIILRYHGPDQTVNEELVTLKGKGETITIGDKKLFFFKTKKGSTFMLNEDAIRRRDDMVNEISYNYKSVMPLNPIDTVEEVRAEREKLVTRLKDGSDVDDPQRQANVGVQVDQLTQYTDPKRLNRLIEYISLAAKAEALARMGDLEKWVKYGLYAAAAGAIASVFVAYTLNQDVMPLLMSVKAAVENIGTQVLKL